ncbi:hypothetical protein KGF57_004955 [Candida theae]|uniref:Uncharacterized protein n=1 Tax=Candida theae TaxID=1198502 RepID=A0AAD5BAC2_9ASCO|nr:uncharacterized protein KGF57_004955 [Candida theae]KAI5949125.1 hypothetical protein KGF57_004955 [Candida theae]
MDPNHDIFAQLDTALLDIFHQNHTIQHDFNSLPEHERQRVLDEMEDYVRQSSLNSTRHGRIRRNPRTIRRFYEITWYWTYLPLFTIRFDRIFQQLTMSNFQRAVTNAAFYLVNMIQAGLRSLIFLFVLQTYLHNVTNMIFVFSNIITFSSNFIKDGFTYCFQDRADILHDHALLATHNYDCFYYLNLPQYANASIWKHAELIFKNHRAYLLRTSCVIAKDGAPSNCHLITDSLVYKFSDAIAKSCPSLSTSIVRLCTVGIYLVYAMLGNFVCLNILFFLSYNIMRRIAGYANIVKNLSQVIGSTFVEYIA